MPPKLILIRHAEAAHNATEDYDLPDPSLTQNGLQQCKELQEHLRQHCQIAHQIEHIVTSPMRRTLQTTLTGLEWLIARGVPVEVDAMWQAVTLMHPQNHPTWMKPASIKLMLSENYDGPCDTGSELEILAAEFPHVDFTQVDPTYPDKSFDTLYAFRRSTNVARGQSCLRRLFSRPEKVIAVVSHSGFLRTSISKRRYDYADYRIFTFRQNGTQLGLVEDSWTARNGGAMGRSAKGVQRIREWDFPPEYDEVDVES